MVTAAMKLKGTCSLEEKAMTNLGRKSYAKPRQHITKQRHCFRDITLLTKFWIVKAMVSPVVMYGYEDWTIKKAEQ